MKNILKKLFSLLLCGALLLPTCASAEEITADRAEVNIPDNAFQVLDEFNNSVVAAYENKNISLDSDAFVNTKLFSQLKARNDYIQKTQSSYDIVDNNTDFRIDKVIKINNDTLKVLATRTVEQTLSYNGSERFPFYSSTREGFILQKVDNMWKIARVVDEIYGINLTMDAFVQDFDNRIVLAKCNSEVSNMYDVVQDLGGIDYLNLPDTMTESTKEAKSLYNTQQLMGYMYSKAKACTYALRWGGSNRNPLFSDYSYSGGDCANFTSQCLNAGGMTYTSSWSPDSYQFINVEGQRDMLVNTGRAKGCYQYLPTYPNNMDRTGTVVHYTNGSAWYHAVIITQDPMTSYSAVRVSGHTANVINGPIWPDSNQIRSFRVY